MYIYMHTHLHVYLWICVHVYTFKRKMLLYKGPVIFCYIMGSISTLSITPVQICLILMFWLLFFSLFPCFPPFTNQMCHAKDFLYPYCQNGASVSFAANTKWAICLYLLSNWPISIIDQHGSLGGEIVPRGCRRDLTENAPLNLILLFHVLSFFILTCNCGGIMDPKDDFIQILFPLSELPLLSEIHINTVLLWCMIEPYVSSAFCPLVILTSGTSAAPVQERCTATTWQFLHLA